MNFPQQGFGNQQFQQPMQQQTQAVVTAQTQDDGTKIVIQGRVIWGQMGPTNKKVYGTNQDQIDPKTGKPVIEYVFGLAVPKIGPQSSENEKQNFSLLWNALTTEAGKAGAQWGARGFAWKCFDADDPNETREDGTPYSNNPNYRGHFIVTCSTRIPIPLYAWEQGNPKPVQVTDKDIKAGDYVQVALTINAHKPPNPGLYVNPTMVCRFAFGEAIVAQRDASKVFAAPPPIPQGGSLTPIGTAPAMNFGGSMMSQPQQFNQQPMQGMPQQFQQQQAPMGNGFGQNMNGSMTPNNGGTPFNQQQAPVNPNFEMLPPQMQQPAQQQWQTQQAMQQQAPVQQMPGQPYNPYGQQG